MAKYSSSVVVFSEATPSFWSFSDTDWGLLSLRVLFVDVFIGFDAYLEYGQNANCPFLTALEAQINVGFTFKARQSEVPIRVLAAARARPITVGTVVVLVELALASAWAFIMTFGHGWFLSLSVERGSD